jgi:hypothetical protein
MPEIDQFNPKPVKTNPKGKNYSYKTKKERFPPLSIQKIKITITFD